MTHCLACCGELMVFQARQLRGEIPDDAVPPRVNEAQTWAPNWQQTVVGMQQMLACIAVPTCMAHLEAKEMSPADRAVVGGKIIPGRLGNSGPP